MWLFKITKTVRLSRDYFNLKTREIILKYFDIVALVKLGGQTFSKAKGTITVILFLRRKAQQPEPAEHYYNRVIAFFDGVSVTDDGLAIHDDLYLVKKYCEHIEVKFEDYINLLNVNLTGFENLSDLMQYDMFKDYKTNFDKSTMIKNLKKSRTFKAKDKTEQDEELNKLFISYLQEIEQDKLYYFILAYTNPQKVLIVKSPTKNADQKKFLGYEWSNSKGKEGIKYYGGETVHDIITPMFDPKSIQNFEKINYFIQQNFLGNAIAELPQNCSYANMTDILDFSQKDFNKVFSLTPKKSIVIDTKWNLVKIGDLAKTSSGGTPLSSKLEYYENGKILWVNSGEVREGVILDTENKITELGFQNSSAKIFPIDTVLVAMYGATAGQVGILGVEASTNQAVCGIFPNKDYNSKYLFYYLSTQLNNFLALRAGTARLNLNQNTIQNFKIPLPPLNIQQQIVEECETIDKSVAEAQETVKAVRLEIEEKVKAVYEKGFEEKKISEIAKINPSKREIKDVDENLMVSFVEMASVSNDGFIEYKEDRKLKDLKKGSYTYFAENDIIIAKITPCMENGKCAIAKNLTNKIGMGSSEFHVIRTNETVLTEFAFPFLNREMVRKEAEKIMTGSSGHRRVPARFYENFKIPVPPLTEQKALIKEITTLENKIATAEAVIAASSEHKQAVMNKYL